MARTVKVHDDTHIALKKLKVQRRGKSIDEVIREVVKQATGRSVESIAAESKPQKLTAFLQ